MINDYFSRRKFIELCGLFTFGIFGQKKSYAKSKSQIPQKTYNTYWGDLHNHNMIGYAQGTLRRSFEIARNHLDFFAFTPHAHWHDMATYSNKIENKWINGFAVTKSRWQEVLDMVREFDDPGKFVTIAAYEWHSTSLGDYHILFPEHNAELALFDDLKEFQRFAKKRGCIMIPHHPGNRRGHRGANIEKRDPEVSPVLEIFSEWGNAEHDRAPYPYKRHTEGGRWTRNTLHHLLAEGHRMGVIASTDDHLGYPGAYREGLAAIKAKELSRESIFDAIRNRRTYAVTGDRIDLDFWINGHMMGEECPYTRKTEIQVDVTGWNQVDRVEVLKNNRVIHRDFPMDRPNSSRSWNEPVIIRFDYGWGPWPALGWNRTADWDFEIKLENGSLQAIHPCFTSGPLDESRRDKIMSWDAQGARVISFTALKQQIDDFSQKAVILKVQGGPETRLTILGKKPDTFSRSLLLKELAESNEPIFTRPFPWESAMLSRIIFKENYHTSFTIQDEDSGKMDNWYYVRVIQSNDQLAWSSPIWFDRRGA